MDALKGGIIVVGGCILAVYALKLIGWITSLLIPAAVVVGIIVVGGFVASRLGGNKSE